MSLVVKSIQVSLRQKRRKHEEMTVVRGSSSEVVTLPENCVINRSQSWKENKGKAQRLELAQPRTKVETGVAWLEGYD